MHSAVLCTGHNWQSRRGCWLQSSWAQASPKNDQSSAELLDASTWQQQEGLQALQPWLYAMQSTLAGLLCMTHCRQHCRPGVCSSTAPAAASTSATPQLTPS